MELLVILIAEIVGPLALLVLAGLAELMFLLAELVLEVVCGIRGLPSVFRARPAPGAVARWTRRLGKILLGVTVVLGILLVLLNTVFFEGTLRWALARSSEKTGVEVSFGSARGNFITGNATLQEISVRRQDTERSSIDLKIKEARVEVSMTSLLGSSPRFQLLRLSDVEGSYQRGRVPSSKRDFTIDQFVLERASLVLKEPDPSPSVALTIDRLECRPLRKESAVFDLLFRSNGRGTVAGAAFEIRTEPRDGGRKTFWKAQGVPVGFLSAYVGAPFDWLSAGTVDVDVVDEWSDGDNGEIDSHWKLTFQDLSAEVPARIGGIKRAVAEPVVRFLRSHPARFPLEFHLKLEKGHFTGAASVETTGLVEAAADGLVHELARRAEVPADTLKEYGRRMLEKFKTYVEERKKKKSGG